MRINKNNKFKKNTLAISVGVFLVCMILAGILLYQYVSRQTDAPTYKNRPGQTVNYDKPTADQQKISDSIKSDSNSANKSKQTNTTVTIVRAAQTAQGQPLSIRANVSSAIDNQKCRVVLSSPDSTRVTKFVDVVQQPSYLTCEPLDVPLSELSASVTWKIEVSVLSSDLLVSNVASATVEVRQ